MIEFKEHFKLVGSWHILVQLCSGYHYFIEQSLNSVFAQVHILLGVCWRFGMAATSDDGPSLK